MTISLINKGDLKSHFNDSKKKLGLRHPVLLLKITSDEMSASTIFLGVNISSIVLEKLNKDEQFAIIDHELGHIKRWKEDLIVILYILLPFIALILFYMGVISIISINGWLYISIFLILRFPLLDYVVSLKRDSEFGADKISAELGNATALISSLKKMEKSIKNQTSSRIIRYMNTFFFSNRPTHPSTDERIKKLEEFISGNSI